MTTVTSYTKAKIDALLAAGTGTVGPAGPAGPAGTPAALSTPGLLSARPAPAPSNSGMFYVATDVNGGTAYLSNGTSVTPLPVCVHEVPLERYAVPPLTSVAT